MDRQIFLVILVAIIPTTFALCSTEQTKDDCLSDCGCIYCEFQNTSICTNDVSFCKKVSGVYEKANDSESCKNGDLVGLITLIIVCTLALALIAYLFCSIKGSECRAMCSRSIGLEDA